MSNKTTEVKRLQEQLDTVFSEYIRRKDANAAGFTRCYTSGKVLHWKQMQCGHFKKRRHLGTRWDERNCKPQSFAENIGKDGNDEVFADKLVEEYGPDILSELEIKKNSIFKAGPYEYRLMIEEYKSKIKDLESRNNVGAPVYDIKTLNHPL